MDADFSFSAPPPPRPVPEESWLPGILGSLAAAVGAALLATAAVRHYFQSELPGVTYFALSAASVYGFLIGYANQAPAAARSWLGIPWVLTVGAILGAYVRYSFMKGLLGPLSAPFLILTVGAPWTSALSARLEGAWSAVLTAASAIGCVLLLFISIVNYQVVLGVALGVYGLFAVSMIAGILFRWLVGGRIEFLTSRPIPRLVARQFSLLTIIAVTTGVAVALTLAIHVELPGSSLLPSFLGLIAAGLAAQVTLKLCPYVPEGPGIIRLGPPPAPWVKCEPCGHIARHEHAQCPACGTAYPAAPEPVAAPPEAAAVEADAAEVAEKSEAAPERTGNDWTV